MSFFNFLFPKISFQGSSAYSQDIKIIKIGKTRKLIVNGMVQSFDKDSKSAKNKVWGLLVNNIATNAFGAENILLLGMGAGTMLHMLHKALKENHLETTGIEIDEKIVELAKKHFDLDSLPHNRVIIADAFDVLANPEEYELKNDFDCIIVDTYLGKDYPENVQTKTFLTNLFNLANKDTFIIFNRVIEKKDKTSLKNFLFELSKFMKNPKTHKIKGPIVADNYLVFGYKLI